ncbi:GAF domain-containing protein [Thiospirillum jenense]|uniref:GAF domain-containing protein n=1 Tax=Thiospirillum jenense TaxID=1653858 RepID=A0A839HDG1_9GAMM|nr:GAF domain-containing protein [Thiospirillum jenense]MBB1125059.1 GAF domain-containing protein [Thiospirillum jenense]
MSKLSLQGFVDECEREQLHHAQAIQPFGVLLGGYAGDPCIRYVSANVTDWLQVAPDAVLGQPLTALIPDFPPEHPDVSPNRADVWMNTAPDKTLYPYLLNSVTHGGLDGLLSCTDTHWLLELEQSLPFNQRHDAYRPIPHRFYRMPYSEDEWQRHCQLLTDELRTISGFDRVMLYRFRGDDCGEVINESSIPEALSYSGLRFPASDIPRIARSLYLKNRHRQISDVNAVPVPILGQNGGITDLTLSDLRAVSPVHLQYLRNMEVTASASFPLVLSGRLWGLLACHHNSPRLLPLPVRERCADLAQVFTLAIAGYQNSRRLFEVSGSDHEIAQLLDLLHGAESDHGGAMRTLLSKSLLALVNADGAALVDNGSITTFGLTPDVAAIQAQLDWLTAEITDPVFVTDSLPQVFPPAAAYAERASGLLAIRANYFIGKQRCERVFLWWRPEQPQVVYWAGDPRKSTILESQSQTLSPRSSFASWVETTAGHCEPWRDSDLLRAKKFRNLVLRAINADLLHESRRWDP